MDSNFTARKPPQTTVRMDLEHMPERGSHHRRSHSDTSFRFDDDLLLFESSDLDLSSASRLPFEDSSSSKPGFAHSRSLSMDSDFFDGFGISGEGSDGDFLAGKTAAEDKKIGRHRYSNSMNGLLMNSSFEADSSTVVMDFAKKALGPDKLAELSLIDPKRAKRILANRQSAARSKERKIRYTSELERKVQMLQSEATSLSAQVTVLQRDTTGLTAENRELKLRLQAMEQQAHLRDALNETLREEVQRLKIATGQLPVANGNSFNRVGLPPQFPILQPSLHHFGNPQNHQQQELLHTSPPEMSPVNSQGSASSQLTGV